MPTLQKVWTEQQAAGAPVGFVGVAIKESPESSLAFLRANNVTFPSISDRASAGAPMLALQGKPPPRRRPSSWTGRAASPPECRLPSPRPPCARCVADALAS